MSTASTWGRQETIIWPPHAPIYSLAALAVGLLATLGLVCRHYIFDQTPLQRTYSGTYLRSTGEGLFLKNGVYRLLYVAGASKQPRLAVPADFEDGETVMPDGSIAGVALSRASRFEGYSAFYRAPAQRYANAPLSVWLRTVFFNGQGMLGNYEMSLGGGAGLFAMTLPFAMGADARRYRKLKYGRRLKGPIMLTPRKFNATLKGGGLGIRTAEKGTRLRIPFTAKTDTILRIPYSAEPKHIQIMGDTGAGKSTLIMQILQQIRDRGEAAIVYDPAGEFTQRFYQRERGDWILNPLDIRCPYWSPASELRNPAEARTIATSLYQPTDDKKGEFFTQTPQKIFAHLLRYRPTPEELVEWMSNEAEIDLRVAGTELASIIAKGAQDQRSGVLASLGLVADSLRLLPTKEKAGGREWSATEWVEKREGWIFLTSTEAEQEALRPLHSLWIDLLILRLMTPPKPEQRRAWLVIDELASLQRLPQFHTALTKGRKSENPIVFGYQGKAQLEVIYGHLAEVMLSQPATKFVLKTAEPKAAKWASELIGEIEIERLRETVADGKRAGKSFIMDRQVEPLVMASEIEGLADLHGFVKLENYVSRFSFPHMSLPPIAKAFEPRVIPENTMWFNPLDVKASLFPKDSTPVARLAEAAPPFSPAIVKTAPCSTPEPVSCSPFTADERQLLRQELAQLVKEFKTDQESKSGPFAQSNETKDAQSSTEMPPSPTLLPFPAQPSSDHSVL